MDYLKETNENKDGLARKGALEETVHDVLCIHPTPLKLSFVNEM